MVEESIHSYLLFLSLFKGDAWTPLGKAYIGEVIFLPPLLRLIFGSGLPSLLVSSMQQGAGKANLGEHPR
jgi:hypothetical protein